MSEAKIYREKKNRKRGREVKEAERKNMGRNEKGEKKGGKRKQEK